MCVIGFARLRGLLPGQYVTHAWHSTAHGSSVSQTRFARLPESNHVPLLLLPAARRAASSRCRSCTPQRPRTAMWMQPSPRPCRWALQGVAGFDLLGAIGGWGSYVDAAITAALQVGL